MKKAKRAAARLLFETAATMDGYIGRQICRVLLIAVSTIPACWSFLALFAAMSV